MASPEAAGREAIWLISIVAFIFLLSAISWARRSGMPKSAPADGESPERPKKERKRSGDSQDEDRKKRKKEKEEKRKEPERRKKDKKDRDGKDSSEGSGGGGNGNDDGGPGGGPDDKRAGQGNVSAPPATPDTPDRLDRLQLADDFKLNIKSDGTPYTLQYTDHDAPHGSDPGTAHTLGGGGGDSPRGPPGAGAIRGGFGGPDTPLTPLSDGSDYGFQPGGGGGGPPPGGGGIGVRWQPRTPTVRYNGNGGGPPFSPFPPGTPNTPGGMRDIPILPQTPAPFVDPVELPAGDGRDPWDNDGATAASPRTGPVTPGPLHVGLVGVPDGPDPFATISAAPMKGRFTPQERALKRPGDNGGETRPERDPINLKPKRLSEVLGVPGLGETLGPLDPRDDRYAPTRFGDLAQRGQERSKLGFGQSSPIDLNPRYINDRLDKDGGGQGIREREPITLSPLKPATTVPLAEVPTGGKSKHPEKTKERETTKQKRPVKESPQLVNLPTPTDKVKAPNSAKIKDDATARIKIKENEQDREEVEAGRRKEDDKLREKIPVTPTKEKKREKKMKKAKVKVLDRATGKVRMEEVLVTESESEAEEFRSRSGKKKKKTRKGERAQDSEDEYVVVDGKVRKVKKKKKVRVSDTEEESEEEAGRRKKKSKKKSKGEFESEDEVEGGRSKKKSKKKAKIAVTESEEEDELSADGREGRKKRSKKKKVAVSDDEEERSRSKGEKREKRRKKARADADEEEEEEPMYESYHGADGRRRLRRIPSSQQTRRRNQNMGMDNVGQLDNEEEYEIGQDGMMRRRRTRQRQGQQQQDMYPEDEPARPWQDIDQVRQRQQQQYYQGLQQQRDGSVPVNPVLPAVDTLQQEQGSNSMQRSRQNVTQQSLEEEIRQENPSLTVEERVELARLRMKQIEQGNLDQNVRYNARRPADDAVKESGESASDAVKRRWGQPNNDRDQEGQERSKESNSDETGSTNMESAETGRQPRKPGVRLGRNGDSEEAEGVSNEDGGKEDEEGVKGKEAKLTVEEAAKKADEIKMARLKRMFPDRQIEGKPEEVRDMTKVRIRAPRQDNIRALENSGRSRHPRGLPHPEGREGAGTDTHGEPFVQEPEPGVAAGQAAADRQEEFERARRAEGGDATTTTIEVEVVTTPTERVQKSSKPDTVKPAPAAPPRTTQTAEEKATDKNANLNGEDEQPHVDELPAGRAAAQAAMARDDQFKGQRQHQESKDPETVGFNNVGRHRSDGMQESRGEQQDEPGQSHPKSPVRETSRKGHQNVRNDRTHARTERPLSPDTNREIVDMSELNEEEERAYEKTGVLPDDYAGRKSRRAAKGDKKTRKTRKRDDGAVLVQATNNDNEMSRSEISTRSVDQTKAVRRSSVDQEGSAALDLASSELARGTSDTATRPRKRDQLALPEPGQTESTTAVHLTPSQRTEVDTGDGLYEDDVREVENVSSVSGHPIRQLVGDDKDSHVGKGDVRPHDVEDDADRAERLGLGEARDQLIALRQGQEGDHAEDKVEEEALTPIRQTAPLRLPNAGSGKKRLPPSKTGRKAEDEDEDQHEGGELVKASKARNKEKTKQIHRAAIDKSKDEGYFSAEEPSAENRTPVQPKRAPASDRQARNTGERRDDAGGNPMSPGRGGTWDWPADLDVEPEPKEAGSAERRTAQKTQAEGQKEKPPLPPRGPNDRSQAQAESKDEAGQPPVSPMSPSSQAQFNSREAARARGEQLTPPAVSPLGERDPTDGQSRDRDGVILGRDKEKKKNAVYGHESRKSKKKREADEAEDAGDEEDVGAARKAEKKAQRQKEREERRAQREATRRGKRTPTEDEEIQSKRQLTPTLVNEGQMTHATEDERRDKPRHKGQTTPTTEEEGGPDPLYEDVTKRSEEQKRKAQEEKKASKEQKEERKRQKKTESARDDEETAVEGGPVDESANKDSDEPSQTRKNRKVREDASRRNDRGRVQDDRDAESDVDTLVGEPTDSGGAKELRLGSSERITAHRVSLRPGALWRAGWRFLANAPFWTFLSAVVTVMYVEVSRQLFAMAQITSGSAGTTSLAKRASDGLPLDLSFTSTWFGSLLEGKTIEPITFLAFLCMWSALCLFILGIVIFTTVDKASTPRQPDPDAWWKHPSRTSRMVAHGIKHIVKSCTRVVMLEKHLHGPRTFIARSTRWTALRIAVFFCQLIGTVIVFRQMMSLAYLAGTGSQATFSSLFDVRATEKSMLEIASELEPTGLMAVINFLFIILLISLASSWYALLHPRKSSVSLGDSSSRRSIFGFKIPPARTLLKWSMIVLIVSAFMISLLYFREMASGSKDSSSYSGVADGNVLFWGANGMFALILPGIGYVVYTLDKIWQRKYGGRSSWKFWQ